MGEEGFKVGFRGARTGSLPPARPLLVCKADGYGAAHGYFPASRFCSATRSLHSRARVSGVSVPAFSREVIPGSRQSDTTHSRTPRTDTRTDSGMRFSCMSSSSGSSPKRTCKTSKTVRMAASSRAALRRST